MQALTSIAFVGSGVVFVTADGVLHLVYESRHIGRKDEVISVWYVGCVAVC